MTETSDPRRIFTYEEALDTFPLVEKLTAEAVRQVEALFHRVQGQEELDRRRDELETATQSVVDAWVRQVEGLGCHVKGLWLVDFDSGAGYYCWRYPEKALGHYHGYDEGFAGRVPIQ
jgi:hypothetical protein